MRLERVTVTLPKQLVDELRRRSKNRSSFVQEAVRREIARRVRVELRKSFQHPHPETVAYAGEPLGAWAAGLPREDVTEIYDPGAVRPLRWEDGKGWIRS